MNFPASSCTVSYHRRVKHATHEETLRVVSNMNLNIDVSISLKHHRAMSLCRLVLPPAHSQVPAPELEKGHSHIQNITAHETEECSSSLRWRSLVTTFTAFFFSFPFFDMRRLYFPRKVLSGVGMSSFSLRIDGCSSLPSNHVLHQIGHFEVQLFLELVCPVLEEGWFLCFALQVESIPKCWSFRVWQAEHPRRFHMADEFQSRVGPWAAALQASVGDYHFRVGILLIKVPGGLL